MEQRSLSVLADRLPESLWRSKKSVSAAEEALVLAERPSGRGREQGKA